MALINLKFFSEALGMNTEAIVIMPQKGNYGEIGVDSNVKAGPYKCLYLLHGLSDDHTIWMRRTSIERYAAYYGICVVMPRGDKSFYTDMKYGMAYYTHIAKEYQRSSVNTSMFRTAARTISLQAFQWEATVP